MPFSNGCKSCCGTEVSGKRCGGSIQTVRYRTTRVQCPGCPCELRSARVRRVGEHSAGLSAWASDPLYMTRMTAASLPPWCPVPCWHRRRHMQATHVTVRESPHCVDNPLTSPPLPPSQGHNLATRPPPSRSSASLRTGDPELEDSKMNGRSVPNQYRVRNRSRWCGGLGPQFNEFGKTRAPPCDWSPSRGEGVRGRPGALTSTRSTQVRHVRRADTTRTAPPEGWPLFKTAVPQECRDRRAFPRPRQTHRGTAFGIEEGVPNPHPTKPRISLCHCTTLP